MEWSSVRSSLQLAAPRRFTDRAAKVLKMAAYQAADRCQAAVTPEHVLLALVLVERGPGRVALDHLGLDLRTERAALAALAAEGPRSEPGQGPTSSAEVGRVVDEAEVQARGLGHNYVGTEHLTLALFSAGPSQAEEFLRRRGISPESLREAVLAVLSG